MLRSDYRDRIKNKLATLSTSLPDVFPDSEIDTAFLDALRNLPYKGVYLEEKWQRTLTTTDKEYALPAGTLKAEKVEFNIGTTDKPQWEKQTGWEEFAGSIHLDVYPSTTWTMRIWLKKKFTEIDDDSTTVDVPDDKAEVVVLASVRRLLENLIHYMIDSKNYDSVAKPSGATIPQAKGWRDELRVEEERIIKSFKTTPRPRFIDLVG